MTLHVQKILSDIELALKDTGLWCDIPPEPAAFQSTMPFFCDMMSLAQWLQYVLLPRMSALLAAEQPLPTKIAILPMAEHIYAQQPEITPLLVAIKRLDECLNQQ